MNNQTHVVLLGAGAIGVLPAAKLVKVLEIKLSVAADAQRVKRYRDEGIFLNEEKLPFTYAVPEELTPADLILVATKMPSLAEALENVALAVTEKTVFLPLLNGISAYEVIKSRFPQNPVLKGFHLGHASVRIGNKISHDDVGTIYCGGEKSALDFAVNVLNFIDSARQRLYVVNGDVLAILDGLHIFNFCGFYVYKFASLSPRHVVVDSDLYVLE